MGGEALYSKTVFDKMIDEMLSKNGPKFDTMLYIVDTLLANPVRRWCYEDPALRGKQYEDDIMQEIRIRLIKTCIPNFLFRKEGAINNDPDGFKSWLFRVAMNIRNDFAKKIRKRQFNETEELIDESLSESPESEVSGNEYERLSFAFSIVLNSGSGVYKVLTWIAQALLVLNCDMTRVDATNELIKRFDSMTINDMYTVIINDAALIPWLRINELQKNSICTELKKLHHSGKIIGEMKYCEFYMKKGSRASISDWVNRMDGLICKAGA